MGAQSLFYMAIYVAVLIVFYYIFIVIPGRKRRRVHDEMQKKVTLGDRIVTIGGVSGTVTEANEETLIVASGESKIEILRAAVQLRRS